MRDRGVVFPRRGTVKGEVALRKYGKRAMALVGLILAVSPAASAEPVDLPSAAAAHLQANAAALGLTPGDLVDKIITSRYESTHTGVTHIHYRQRLHGIEVANGVINVNLDRDGRVLSLGNRFVADLASKANVRHPSLDATGAILAAAEQLGLTPSAALARLEGPRGPEQAARYQGEGISADDIPVKLAYFALDLEDVRLVWDMVIRTPDGRHWLNLWVDAADGVIIAESDWIDDASYEVYALPMESPSDGPRTIPVDPADSTASPFGWHDTDGIAGAEFTDTRGNNVEAQTDLNASDSFGGVDIRAEGGASLDFLSLLDLAQGPATYRVAVVTNLFYWNNVIHDLLYGYGFDEASGNFQTNNYGNGGVGGDPVQADAQDGSGTNNANFSTPPDGSDPRMQMYIWSPFAVHEVIVDAPSAAAGTYVAEGAAFGPAFTETGVSSAIILADDGVGTSTDGCEAFPAGFFLGNIALIDRGTCNFVLKVQNAETAGAVAVIVANNAGDDPVTMGDDGTGGSITIPSLMVGQSDGQTIRSGLPATGTARLPTQPPDRDSDLDAGVILHEYCHGLSNRLTGGPANSSCLGGNQQAGEGWSDLCTLFFTADAVDTGPTARGVGTYLLLQPTTGSGIRPHPYSTDLAINPLTYGDLTTAGQTGGLAIPHGVGTVWATAVWEVYWNLVQKLGFDADLYHGTGGNNLAIQLMLDGLKLQPCSPTFLDARDAILAADQNLTGGDNHCELWEGFAKRGMGVNATDGGSSSSLNVGEDFTIPPECASLPVPGESTGLIVQSYDGVTGNLNLSYQAACSAADHTIVYGPLEDVSTYAYSGQDCGIGSTGLYDQFNPGAGSVFFLLVGNDGAATEGSYGQDAGLVERPEDLGDPVCFFSQNLGALCE